MNKYAPLQEYLERIPDEIRDIRLGFDQIAGILREELPPSAYRHRQWWSNNRHHVQALAWMEANWRTSYVSFDMQEVWLERNR